MAEGEHNDMSVGTADNPLVVGGIKVTFFTDGKEQLTFALCGHDGRQEGKLESYQTYICRFSKSVDGFSGARPPDELDDIKRIKQEDVIKKAKEALQAEVGVPLESSEIEILEPPRKHSRVLDQLLRGKGFSNGDRRYCAYEMNENAAIKVVFKQGDKEADELTYKEQPFWFRCPIQLQENQSYWIKLEWKGETTNTDIREMYQFELSEAGTPRGYLTYLPSNEKELNRNLNYHESLLAGQILVKEKKVNGESGEVVFKFPIVVVPRKIELKDLEQIFEDVMREHAQLLFTYKGPTGARMETKAGEKKNPLQKLRFIEWFFTREPHRLDRLLLSIVSNPDKKLITEQSWEDLAFATSPSMEGLYEMFTRSEIMVRAEAEGHFRYGAGSPEQSYRFTQVLEEQSHLSYDTYPNRFVKFFLKFMITQLNEVEALLRKNMEDETTYKYWDVQAKVRERTIRKYLNTGFFQEVSDLHGMMGSSQVLQNEPRYREVFKAYLDLVRGLALSFDELEEMLNDPIKAMHELYEYWCFFELKKELEKLMGTPSKTSIETKRDEKKGTGEYLAWNICTRFEKDGLAATLFYNLETGKKGKNKQI